MLLALFQIMKEEGRHLRLNPLPSCVWGSLSSLCLNCQWAQLGLCFQYPLSTLHVIRKENQNGSPTCFQGHGPRWMAGARSQRGGHRDHCSALACHPSCFRWSSRISECSPETIYLPFVRRWSSALPPLQTGFQGSPSPHKSPSQNQVLCLWYPSRIVWEAHLVCFWKENSRTYFLSVWGSLRSFQKTTILFRVHRSVGRGVAIAFVVNVLNVFL